MPIYEFICKKCNKIVEEMVAINSTEITKCVHCDSIMEKLLSNTSYPVFKGKHFYETEYKKKK